MKTTTFYKLRKPEGTDPVNLEDFNVNFDDIDKALKEASDASGDLSRGKVFATQASERANFDSGDTLATGFGKIMKWFSDLKSAAFATLVNNDITTAEGYAADARIVKAHGDEIDALVTKTDNMKASFQAGVDGIYNAITAQGTTPASKSQSDVQAAIPTLANSSYNKGYANRGYTTRSFNFSGVPIGKDKLTTLEIDISLSGYSPISAGITAFNITKNHVSGSDYGNFVDNYSASLSGNTATISVKVQWNNDKPTFDGAVTVGYIQS